MFLTAGEKEFHKIEKNIYIAKHLIKIRRILLKFKIIFVMQKYIGSCYM